MYVLTQSFHTVPVVILFLAHLFSTGTSTNHLHLYGKGILPHQISRIVRLRSTTMCALAASFALASAHNHFFLGDLPCFLFSFLFSGKWQKHVISLSVTLQCSSAAFSFALFTSSAATLFSPSNWVVSFSIHLLWSADSGDKEHEHVDTLPC